MQFFANRSILSALLLTTSLFANEGESCKNTAPCLTPTPPTQICEPPPRCPAFPMPLLHASYNYPSQIETGCPWDLYAHSSFLFWQPLQENMEPGFIFEVTSGEVLNGTYFMDGYFENQNFTYRPGFQIGVGMNFDHDYWDSSLTYTWFHTTELQRAKTDPRELLIRVLQGHEHTIAGPPRTMDSQSQKWHLKMDFLDWDLGRAQYTGANFTMRPSIGMRFAWIRQKMYSTYSASALSGAIPATIRFSGRSNSWALGPRGTLKTQFHIGRGFSLIGNGALDLLYTRYTKLNQNSRVTTDAISSTTSLGSLANQKDLNYLRTHLEFELGFAWGTYLNCHSYFLDLAATYGWQVFVNQNMFRDYQENSIDARSAISNNPNGDLFVHGLNLTCSVHF